MVTVVFGVRQEAERVRHLAVKVHGHDQPIGIPAHVEHDHRLPTADMDNVSPAIAAAHLSHVAPCGRPAQDHHSYRWRLIIRGPRSFSFTCFAVDLDMRSTPGFASLLFACFLSCIPGTESLGQAALTNVLFDVNKSAAAGAATVTS